MQLSKRKTEANIVDRALQEARQQLDVVEKRRGILLGLLAQTQTNAEQAQAEAKQAQDDAKQACAEIDRLAEERIAEMENENTQLRESLAEAQAARLVAEEVQQLAPRQNGRRGKKNKRK